MAVTFDMNEAKKATEVVIEVTEIVNVECFKVAFTIRTKSSSLNFLLWSINFFLRVFVFDILWCSASDCSSSFKLLIVFDDERLAFILLWALAHWLVHALTNINVSSAPTPKIEKKYKALKEVYNIIIISWIS